MSTLVDLFRELASELGQALPSYTVERRYMPLRKFEEFQNGPIISIYLEEIKEVQIARGSTDLSQFTFGIAVQFPAADSVAFDNEGFAVLEGVDNLEQGDLMLNLTEEIKSLWKPGGALREKTIAGCVHVSTEHEPPYEPLHLLTSGIYSAILDVTYQTTWGE